MCWTRHACKSFLLVRRCVTGKLGRRQVQHGVRRCLCIGSLVFVLSMITHLCRHRFLSVLLELKEAMWAAGKAPREKCGASATGRAGKRNAGSKMRPHATSRTLLSGSLEEARPKQTKLEVMLRYAPFSDPIPCPLLFLSPSLLLVCLRLFSVRLVLCTLC